MAKLLVPAVSNLLLVLAVLVVALPAAVHGQTPEAGPPITYQNVHDGDVLAEHPHVFQFCFAEPVNIETPGEDYDFGLEMPEGIGLSQRTVFQADGYGVSIYPGSDLPELPPGLPTAEAQVWTFRWMVTAADDDASAEGEIHFTLAEDATTIPQASTSPCLASGFTVGPAAGAGAGAEGDSDSGVDGLLIVLIAAGVVTGLAIAGAIALVIRRRGRTAAPPPA